MPVNSRYFKYFLTQTATGLPYYIDQYGNVQLGNVMTGVNYALPQDPDGWLDSTIGWGRNAQYWGINRSFTVPLKFVGDGATIIRNLFYKGRGIEQPITLVITKWDEDLGYFDRYYSGQLDLTQNINDVAEGVTVNVMEGGILQLLKNYGNTIVTIPCDGSIPENIKVLADGIKFNDTFNYTILKIKSPYAGENTLPCVFQSNSGDNIGITHGDQQLDQLYANYPNKSSNFIFSSLYPVTVRIVGSISVMSDQLHPVDNTAFYMYAVTSFTQTYTPTNGADHAVGLVTAQQSDPTPPVPNFTPSKSSTIVNGQRTFGFDATISLAANENLFILYLNDFAASPINILGGSFQLIFTSRMLPSRVWGITAANVWKIIGQKLNALSTTSDYVFNYAFTSDLLQEFENLVITSGDAARASTDPDYFQYYNQATINPQNPNNPGFTQFASIGPVIKISVADFFDSINAVLLAAIGNQLDSDGNDSVFLEERQYVMDSSEVTLALPEVSNFKVSVDTDKYFNWLEVGYAPNQYDEESGKFEYNNTTQRQAPIKTISKTLQIISKIRADSYGFEFTRFNTQGGKSTTFNNSDSSLWFLNTDFTQSSPDYYSAKFTSQIPDINSTSNTDITLQKGLAYQSLVAGTLDGEYFIDNVDFSIFMFNQPAPGSQTVAVSFSALLNGIIGDLATIRMYINGAIVKTWSAAITVTNTPFNGVYNNTQSFNKGDNIYFTIDTVRTCTVSINAFSINVGSGYFICQNAGPINIAAGSTEQLISLPVISANTVVIGGITFQVVSYGFQYFRFLSNIQNPSFNWEIFITGFIQGSASETAEFDLWKNGVKIATVSYNGAGGLTQTNFNPGMVNPFGSGTDSYNNYDLFWITASCGNVNTYVSGMELIFNSNSIRAYKLTRENYSSVSGLPNPDSAFNLEVLSPMRMTMRNGPMLSSILAMIGAGSLTFQIADKNEFVSTTLNGETITENADIDIHSLGDKLWLPLIFDFDTQVPISAYNIFNFAANGHISFPYKGKTFYGFPIQVTIKPNLNDSQSWKLLASPLNNLDDLVNLDWDGIPILQMMDTYLPYANSIHFVRLNVQKAARYNTYNMDEDWFVNRITDYVDKNNYFAPWQLSDTISAQCQSYGLSPATLQILNGRGQPIGSPINMPTVTTASVLAPQTVYQYAMRLSGMACGKYYISLTIGTGAAAAQYISEGIHIKKYWAKTQIYEYWNTRNKQGIIFNSATPFRPMLRMFSQINSYVPKTTFKTFVDEPQDIELLNSISYDTWTLEMGFGSGMPDYMSRKIDRIFGLDTILIDGDQYSRDADAEVTITQTQGQAKVYAKLGIRKSENSDGILYNTEGQIEGPQQAGYILNADAFGSGDNTGQNLVQVNFPNS